MSLKVFLRQHEWDHRVLALVLSISCPLQTTSWIGPKTNYTPLGSRPRRMYVVRDTWSNVWMVERAKRQWSDSNAPRDHPLARDTWPSMPHFEPSGTMKAHLPASSHPVGAILGPCWGHLGTILEPSWGHLATMFGHLHAENAEKTRIFAFSAWCIFKLLWGILKPS